MAACFSFVPQSELVTVSMFVSPPGHVLIHDISSVSPMHNSKSYRVTRCTSCEPMSAWVYSTCTKSQLLPFSL